MSWVDYGLLARRLYILLLKEGLVPASQARQAKDR